LLYLVTQIRTTVKSTVGWRPGNGFRKSFQGSSRIKDEMGPESSKSGAGKSDLHLAAELGGKYEALGPKKGSKKSGLHPTAVRQSPAICP